jgi:lipid-binding SYLF domain-containing protein
MRSEILTYSRSRGLFAGLSLKGAVLRPDNDANAKLYGREVDAKELIEKASMAVPEPASKFIESVSKASSGK